VTKKVAVSGLAPAIVSSIADASIPARSLIGTKLFGIGGSLTAGVPAASTGQFYMQTGSNTITTNSSMLGTVTFPTPFPNGLVTAVIVQGDTTASGPFEVLSSSVASGINFQTNVASTLVRVNWIAIGW
jgi:hypothetical protein